MAPVRTCIGCRTSRPVASLVRYAADADGNVVQGRALPGRGAWVCADPSCLQTALSKGAFAKAFRRRVSVEALHLRENEELPATSQFTEKP